MTMQEGRVGDAKGAAGSSGAIRLDTSLAQVVTQAGHGKYYQQAKSNKVFYACNTAAQAITVALATTYTGLCVSNPGTSTVNLVMLRASFAQSAAPSTFPMVSLIGGHSAAGIVTHTTALTNAPNSTQFTGKPAIAKADSACTIVNPFYIHPLFSSPATGTLPVSGTRATFDLDGLFVLPPGAWMAIGALTVATGFSGFVWEEIPIV